MANTLLEQALEYFNADRGFRQLFTLFRKKYESLGRIGGTVKITTLSDSELASVARFFGLQPDELKEKGTVSLLAFQEQLNQTKFESLELLALLEGYFGEEILSKKVAQEKQREKELNTIAQLESLYPNLSFWFNYLRKRSADTYWIFKLLYQDVFNDYVKHLSKAMSELPCDYERLPVFSQRITHNPHAFDLKNNLGKLLLHVLNVHGGNQSAPSLLSDGEMVNNLLQHYYLLRDDITNYVSCANIVAETKDGIHPMWKAAAETKSVMNVPLREILDVSIAYPKDKNNKRVWIVENSGVFSSLLDAVPHAPLLCTHGQFKLAALKLLDILTLSDCLIYYAGDFDPEGLAMAARIKERYPSNSTLWRMDLGSYNSSKPSVSLEPERINKLNSIELPQLLPIADEMKKIRKAGYQEALLKEMTLDLSKSLLISV
ncbi:uncharacterized protein (TIGR02679 family) [Desulfitispora alkaliphila]|uniref:TIGR02679 family protein n=1 Tax=Desulfitispora alkaliphila TaxID=622674 RepID=UPI003D25B7A0